jgi:hypothetical protein
MFVDLLTPQRLSFALGLPVRQVERMAQRGQLPAIVIDGEFRFREKDIISFIEQLPAAVQAPPQATIEAR